ncbi:MAG: RNA methyltransferase [Bacillota bacterium]|nr:RNA methyltransferase [Bacillota bacterium]MDW7676831.1 RNA methyltransferase [Bacillota bacterium]
MPLTIITSPKNPICKLIASLQQRKFRQEYRQFVLEGLRGVRDAAEAGWRPVFYIVSDHFFSQQHSGDLMEMMEKQAVNGYRVPNSLMKKLSNTETPQGLMAVFSTPLYALADLLQHPAGFWLVLDRIQDPGNLGTLIRSAEGAGATGVLLTHGTTDPYSAKALRAATGAVLHLPVIELSEAASDCRMLKEAGMSLVGAALEEGISYHQAAYQLPLALIIGNEANGIAETILERVDHRVTIPMKGRLQSLNASIAGSILLFHMSEKLEI